MPASLILASLIIFLSGAGVYLFIYLLCFPFLIFDIHTYVYLGACRGGTVDNSKQLRGEHMAGDTGERGAGDSEGGGFPAGERGGGGAGRGGEVVGADMGEAGVQLRRGGEGAV